MRYTKFVAVILATIVASGCSAGSSTTSNGVKSYDEAMKESEAAKTGLSLPAGRSWDQAAKPQRQTDGQKMTFEDGAAPGKVQAYWLCSWQQEWLKTRGVDAARERAALANLDKFKTLRLYEKNFDDGSRKFYDDELAKAHLGDPSGIQVDIKANCA